MLRLEAVAFGYAGGPAWRFDLAVAPGEILGISGASGSGKSTLLDLVAGFLTPHAGEIALDGVSLLPLPPEERPVSILFQSDNLFEHLSAAKNLDLGLPATLPAAEKRIRIAGALSDMGLGDPGPRPVSRLSGGQQQRVALARTLLRDRPILLLDEPFTALDAETASALRAHVRRLVKSKAWRAILVSHDSNDLAIADRVLALRDGELAPA